MIFIKAFIVGGIICAIGQLILDYFKLTPAHITCGFVVVGAALDVFGLYDKLIKFAGAGAQLPIMSFGHSVIHGAMEKSVRFYWNRDGNVRFNSRRNYSRHFICIYSCLDFQTKRMRDKGQIYQGKGGIIWPTIHMYQSRKISMRLKRY